MPTRRIARELAIIIFPQLPKNKKKLEQMEFAQLVGQASRILIDYAKQNIQDASAFIEQANAQLLDAEMKHPDNDQNIDHLVSVNLNSSEVRVQLEKLERTINFISEAIDIPEMALTSGYTTEQLSCRKCHTSIEVAEKKDTPSQISQFLNLLIDTYLEHKDEIDHFIQSTKSKWRLDRMVSIDRDILRLACTEAFFIKDVPVNVAISEAIELSHRFADEKAAKFINGILGDLSKEANYFRKQGKFFEVDEEEVSGALAVD